MDKTGIWQSPNGWNFVPNEFDKDNKTFYIENASNDTLVLGINGDDGKFVKKNNVKRQQEYDFFSFRSKMETRWKVAKE